MSTTMSHARLLAIIESYGAHPDRWPAGEREAAERLLDGDPGVFAQALSQARQLDAMLGDLPGIVPSAQLGKRILAQAPAARKAPGRVSPFFPGRRWMPAGALMAAAAGLLAGLTLAPAAGAREDTYSEIEILLVAALGFEAGDYSLETDQ